MEMENKTLMDCFSIVVDPRLDRMKRHKLIDILVMTMCGVLSGFDEFCEIADYAEEKKDWFQTFLELPNGIPSHDTFGRVFSLICPESFQRAFRAWLESLQKKSELREIISIDGKFLRSALREAGRSKSAIAVVSAWTHETGLCLGQTKYEAKKEEGEKRAMETLLEKLFIKGCIVTLDANGATPRLAQKVVENGGDYMIGLKGNQDTIFKYAQKAFEDQVAPTSSFKTEEKAHGRKEIREYLQLNIHDIDYLNMSPDFFRLFIDKWPHLNSFLCVHSIRELRGEKSEETRWYFSSLKGDVAEAAKAIRAHWGVENNLHHVLDVTFREDHLRMRLQHAAENMAFVRRMAINMLKKKDPKLSFKRKRHRCNWSNDYLEDTLFAQIQN
jgi:predicted transposase YbfD/YdcC